MKMAECIDRGTAIAKLTALEVIEPNATMADARRLLAEIPAADVAPVRHAEWVVCGDGDNVPWMCSHCGKTTAHKYKVIYGKYCPN
jgi:hypothetical protein